MHLTAKEKEECQKILKFCGETPVHGVEAPVVDTWSPTFYKTELKAKSELEDAMKELNE